MRLAPPGPRDPLKLAAAPLMPPGGRSREAIGLAAAAARGRFMLQVCGECELVQYPPRAVCGGCLGVGLRWRVVPAGGALLARTIIRIAADPYFRTLTPWAIGTVQLDCGPRVVAHLHGDVAGRVRMTLKLDKVGQGVMLALPEQDTPDMHDDPAWRALTADPRGRRVLVTDGRTALGQAMARGMLAAGARAVFVGIAAPWLPFDGAGLRMAGIETVALDVTDQDSVHRMVVSLGGRVEICVNTALHLRPAGVLAQDLGEARAAMEVNYLGALRLAQALGPAMRARAADGDYPAVAWVNLISAHALAAPGAFGGAAAAQAAALALAQSLRPALRPLRVVNALIGPIDDEWHQALPPPKLAPAAIAAAVVRALCDGVEDLAIGDVAQDILARWADNPAILVRDVPG